MENQWFYDKCGNEGTDYRKRGEYALVGTDGAGIGTLINY